MNNNILISSWFNLQSSVPSSYVQPSKSRPDNIFVLSAKKILVVDLGGHVINHRVLKELMDDTMNIFKEFHVMPEVEKISESSKDPNGSCEFMEFWPHKPTRYR
ncbi:hypothetical protein QL285_033774 [Trifolium repens]|nr:hypothetical protein QL285_033774 [Trifolium repens]